METQDKQDNVFLARAHRLVVKVGTSTLTHATGKLNLFQLEYLVRELADLKHQNKEVILVTSGAMGTAMGKLGLSERPKSIPEKQALAAIGQGLLMHMYEKLFGEYGEGVAQILLTRDDICNRERYLNARNTLLTLLRMGIIPIINENDTIAYEEIKFGDNDTLAALVACLVDADLLVLLSDIDGLYTADPRKDRQAKLIKLVEEITPEIENLADKSVAKLAKGGMPTKILAAKTACSSGIPMLLVNGSRRHVLHEIINGHNPGTLFKPKNSRLKSRKEWIGFASRSYGLLWVDEGAAQALVEKGKSLLPSGIVRVEGDFQRGTVVSIMGPGGEIARGIVNYSSDHIKKIMGCQSRDIAGILGQKDYDEVIHRDNLTLKV